MVSRAAICAFILLADVYLGGNVRYDRGTGACSGQKEGGDKDDVFLLENGATLKYVLIWPTCLLIAKPINL